MSGDSTADSTNAAASDEAAALRRERIARAKAAYARTVRNESGESSAGSNDERLMAERPPHWQVKNRR